MAICIVNGHAELNPNCRQYKDCDTLVACQLAYAIDDAMSGINIDYNKYVADAISSNALCTQYADGFKENIDIAITNDIRLNIDWKRVKSYLSHELPSGEDAELINAIVDTFGPDNEQQLAFFTALATSYVNTWHADNTTWLDDAFVLYFLGEDDNILTYNNTIIQLTGTTEDEDLGIDVDWDGVLLAVSEVLDQVQSKRTAMVCENNRSYQWSIDMVGWLATAVAAVLTFYVGGAGGAAVGAGRAALGGALKTAAKGVRKVGGKTIAKKMAQASSKQLVKSARLLRVPIRKGVITATPKGLMRQGARTFVKQVGKNLTNKWTAIAAGGALVYQIGSTAINPNAAAIYSLIDSSISKDYINCRDLDHNEGCYTVCGDDPHDAKTDMDDFLNAKAFMPMFNTRVCVNPDNYMLHKIDANGNMGAMFVMDGDKWSTLKSTLSKSVVDQSASKQWGCDWNEDDIDMYVGKLIYDPDTLEIDTSAMIVDDFLRIDD
ncbi:MAG: hypothetical protein J5679_02455 [Alphaproteobacteria bacterium]|nr:hypothetical protein [Alphaproteobacteria bacterium]